MPTGPVRRCRGRLRAPRGVNPDASPCSRIAGRPFPCRVEDVSLEGGHVLQRLLRPSPWGGIVAGHEKPKPSHANVRRRTAYSIDSHIGELAAMLFAIDNCVTA